MDFIGDGVCYITTFAIFFVASPLQSAFNFDELSFYKVCGTVFGLLAPYRDRDKKSVLGSSPSLK